MQYNSTSQNNLEGNDCFCLVVQTLKLQRPLTQKVLWVNFQDNKDSQIRFSGWNGLKVKAMMVSVKVNRLTLIPVSAFQIVMELGLSITARRSRHASWGRYRGKI